MKSQTLIRICKSFKAEATKHPGAVTSKLKRKLVRLCGNYKGTKFGYGLLKGELRKAKAMRVTR